MERKSPQSQISGYRDQTDGLVSYEPRKHRLCVKAHTVRRRYNPIEGVPNFSSPNRRYAADQSVIILHQDKPLLKANLLCDWVHVDWWYLGLPALLPRWTYSFHTRVRLVQRAERVWWRIKWCMHLRKWGICTLVRMTNSSRGRLNFLMAFPRMISERPFEYT